MTSTTKKSEELRARIIRVLEQPCSIEQIMDLASVSANVARKAIRKYRGNGVRVCDWGRNDARPFAIYQVGTDPDEPEPPKYERSYARRKAAKLAKLALSADDDFPSDSPCEEIVIQRDWLVAAFFGGQNVKANNSSSVANIQPM